MTASIISVAAIVILVAIDYLIKYLVVSNMSMYESITAIEGLLNWTYITNSGASWGILSGKTIFLVIITFALIVFMIYSLVSGKITNMLCRISFILVAAGGIGNLIDRVFNDGKVIDYIDISPLFSFPVFNFADCCVCVGAVLFCVYVIFFYDDKKKSQKTEETQEESNETV